MPSGPPELHEHWCNKGPYNGDGDLNAQSYLKSRGFRNTNQWEWIKPVGMIHPEPEDWRAINYLIWEWDWGGLADG